MNSFLGYSGLLLQRSRKFCSRDLQKYFLEIISTNLTIIQKSTKICIPCLFRTKKYIVLDFFENLSASYWGICLISFISLNKVTQNYFKKWFKANITHNIFYYPPDNGGFLCNMFISFFKCYTESQRTTRNLLDFACKYSIIFGYRKVCFVNAINCIYITFRRFEILVHAVVKIFGNRW